MLRRFAKPKRGMKAYVKRKLKKYTSKAKGRKKYSKKRTMRRTGGSSRVTAAPVQMGVSVSGGLQASFTQKQMSGGGLRITGRSFITSVDSINKYGNGLLAVHDCNPVLLNDRVATIATTYEKYVYQSITYRFVPQCATTTPGSIMLTFERDPANPAANGGDATTFMQNVMSYEHTAISPPWVGTSVTYKRDTNEKKTFWISGQGSNFDARDTSQGLFLCYGANVPVATGLGFIVMDYVLDLCQPSIMPARTGAGIAGAGQSTNIPSQWQFSSSAMINKAGAVGQSINANTFLPGAFNPATLFGGANSDCIIDLLLEGTTVPSAGTSLWATSEVNAKAAVPIPTTLTRGSHLYLTLRRTRTAGVPFDPSTVASSGDSVIVTRNLADAIAALAGTYDAQLTQGYAWSNSLFAIQTTGGGANLQVSGYYRQLTLRSGDDFQV